MGAAAAAAVVGAGPANLHGELHTGKERPGIACRGTPEHRDTARELLVGPAQWLQRNLDLVVVAAVAADTHQDIQQLVLDDKERPPVEGPVDKATGADLVGTRTAEEDHLVGTELFPAAAVRRVRARRPNFQDPTNRSLLQPSHLLAARIHSEQEFVAADQ